MSAKVFKYILVITNLILIGFAIIGIVLSYFILTPKIIDEYNIKLGLYTIVFSSWGVVLIFTSICLLGIVFTSVICLHLIAALFLCCPLALSIWLLVEQFMFKDEPNATVVTVCLIASILWTIQIFSELILACIICCSPREPKKKKKSEDEEQKQSAKPEEKRTKMKEVNEHGTDDEKEKLMISANEVCVETRPTSTLGSTKGSTRGSTPRPDSRAKEEEEFSEQEDASGVQEVDDGRDSSGDEMRAAVNPPQELALETIPEERQNLLNHHTVQCPLATPEDTGV